MYAKTIPLATLDAATPVEPATSRRDFVKLAGAGALVLGILLESGTSFAENAPGGGKALAPAPGDGPRPDAFVKIAPDDTVTVVIKHLDKGQGVTTGLPTIVAEELDADWSQMRFAFAPANAQLYNNTAFGPAQGTGGSTSVSNSWQQLRKAGAAARAMLVAAAAETWKVPASEIKVERGVLTHGSGKSARFGELAEAAAKQPIPASVTLKDQKDFKLIGSKLHRIDHIEKTNGKALYALDIRRPGMLTAVTQRPPRFGATVKSVDDKAARAVKGVVDVVVVPQGVAVLAENTYAARKGRDALKVAWDDTKAEMRSSADMLADFRTAAAAPGATAAKAGDAEHALGAGKVIEAEFVFPYLAHAPMEPLNCIVEKAEDGGYDFYAGSQFQTVEQAVAAQILGVKPEKVRIHTVWAGGSFGRRATPNADYFADAAAIMKKTDETRPVHLVWTREDDIKGGRYRPMFYHKIRASLDDKGSIAAWHHRLVGQSFMKGTSFEPMMVKNGVDATAVEGVTDMPYAIPNLLVDWHDAPSPITTLWWRSVGHSHTAQAVEVMIDELAHAAGRDAVAFRLALLGDKHPRHAGVLKLAAEKAKFGEKLPKGKGRGIALHESFNTYVAMVADVTVDGTDVKVDRVVVAVDCGIAVNPQIIEAQMAGGVGYGLGAALRNQITFKKGEVEQANFDTYQPLRMSDMPVVEVYIVSSNETPTGVGEPGVPPIAPAVSNAIFAATGKRMRSLPIDLEGAKGA